MKSLIRNEGVYWTVCLLGLALVGILVYGEGEFEYFFECFKSLSLESKTSGILLAIVSVFLLFIGYSEASIGLVVLGLLFSTLGSLISSIVLGVSPKYLMTSFTLLLVAAVVSTAVILLSIFDQKMTFELRE